MAQNCPECGAEYERLAMHWNRSECDYHPFSPQQQEMLQGLLMGDADLHGLGDTNPHFRIRMTNEEFLEYLDRRLGVLSKGVYLARTAQEQFETACQNRSEGRSGFSVVNKSEYNALYGLRTCSHPELNSLRQWYQNGEKRFPKDLRLSPELCRMWYVCDGWLTCEENANSRAMFKVSNEASRSEYLQELFEHAGFDVGFSREAIQVPHTETIKLLQWLGDPPPGFEHKWDI